MVNSLRNDQPIPKEVPAKPSSDRGLHCSHDASSASEDKEQQEDGVQIIDNDDDATMDHSDNRTTGGDCEPTTTPLSERDRRALQKAYVFLSESQFSQLRAISSRWKLLHSGATQNRIYRARIFHFLYERVQNQTHEVGQLLCADHSWGYIRFLEEWTKTMEIEIPTLQEIRRNCEYPPKTKATSKASRYTARNQQKKRKKCSTPKKTSEGKNAKPNPPTTSDLARLLLVFQLYEAVRDSYTKSLTKAALNGNKSKVFWDTVVAQIFNNCDFKPQVSFSAPLSDVDPSQTPPIKRSGAFLSSMLQAFQLAWSPVERGYRISRQNCPDFETYLVERQKKDVLTGFGRKLLVCGEILRIGSRENEDKVLLDVLNRNNTALGSESGLERKGAPPYLRSEERTPAKRRRSGQRRQPNDHISLASDAIMKACNAFKGTSQTSQRKVESWNYLYSEQILESITKASTHAEDPDYDEEVRQLWLDHKERLVELLQDNSPVKSSLSKSRDSGD